MTEQEYRYQQILKHEQISDGESCLFLDAFTFLGRNGYANQNNENR
jgi:hypothetical protein